MKIILRFLWTLSVTAFCLSHANAALTDTNGFRLTVELQDGSKLIGKAGDENYQFRSDVLGEVKLSLGKIRSITWQTKTNAVKLTTSKGDVLLAQFAMKGIRIETAFGNEKLPASQLKGIQVSPMGRLAKSRPGLIALWSGDGNGSDSVGGNDATLTDVTFADGQVGQAFSLNGYSSYLKAPCNSTLNVNGDGLTMTAWIKPSESAGYHPILQWTDSSGRGVNLRIGHSPADLGVLYGDLLAANNLFVLVSPPGIVVSGKFQFVALTYDKTSGQALLYLNGMVVAETQLNTPMSFSSMIDFWIGRRMPSDSPGSWGYNCFFSGLLDEAAIYNRALSAEEIKAIGVEENNGEPLPPPTPNMQRPRSINGTSRDFFN